MSMTQKKTNTKTSTQTKTNTKCFNVIFVKSRRYEDFKYDMDMDMSDMIVMDNWTWTWWTQRQIHRQRHIQRQTQCLKDPMYVIFLTSRGFKDFKYDIGLADMDVVDMDVVDIVMYFLSSIASSYIPSGIEL